LNVTHHVIRLLKYCAIWISDAHLGAKYCQAVFLFDFLKTTECDYLYLLDDINDLWSIRKVVHWPQSHNNANRTILGKARH
jgi:UDP-2,3-diacylglucosamine pyrophosphatase LpxH